MASFDNAGTNVFREEWLRYGNKPSEGGRWYMACDLAGFEAVNDNKSKKRLDNSSISIVSLGYGRFKGSNGSVFVLEGNRIKSGPVYLNEIFE